MRQIITKIALFFAYALFAGFSAYFTATSLALNLTGGKVVWLLFIMVFLVAIAAGWCLTEFIKQLNSMTPSRSKTAFCFIGFLLFWLVSFTTNVHFVIGQKYGFNVLTAELSSCKDFLTKETHSSNKQVQDERDAYIRNFEQEMVRLKQAFADELENSTRMGFADHCVRKLKNIETYLYSDTATLGEKGTHEVYQIWKPDIDKGLIGTANMSKLNGIYNQFERRINNAMRVKERAIKDFYNTKLNSNENYVALLNKVNYLESVQLPAASKDGSIAAAYRYYDVHQSKLIAQMPQEYTQTCMAYKNKGTKESPKMKMAGYDVYPSANMFNTASVWGDMLHGHLPPYMKIILWLLAALVVDIVAYVFAYLLFK